MPQLFNFRARLSLRLLFVVLTGVCMITAIYSVRVERQRKVTEWLNSHGISVAYESAEMPTWITKNIDPDMLFNISQVRLDRATIESIKPIQNLKNLRHLEIASNEDLDLGPLSNLPRLQYLKISTTPISNIQSLAGLQHLKTFHAINTQISDIQVLANLKNLETITLNGSHVSDISSLANHPNLSHLEVSELPITDITPFSTMKSLKTLNIINTNISRADARKLKMSLPNCTILYAPARSRIKQKTQH